ncbi:MAG: hypothetical protein JWM21_1374 [Acidobacteria bacterium]|nr:hypothetical protein [Acidobacteriota bacterium]
MILTLQTTTFGSYGGIPTYNRLVCRALNDLASSAEKQVLVMTDTSSDISNHHGELSTLQLRAFSRKRSAFVGQVLRLGLTRRIDLALIGHVNYASLGWILKQLQPHLRYGVMLYGIDAWQPLSGLRGHALRQADFMISISEFTKRKAVESNDLSAERIHLLPNALEWTDEENPISRLPNSKFGDAATLSRAAGQPIASTGFTILSVCRLDKDEKYKGVDKVIEALPELLKKVPDVQYLVVGGGTDLERHKELARNAGITDRVHFVGFIEEALLRSCYRDCDLFVMPSAGEGFGFVFLEAMKYGKAVVAANSGGAPEVVADGVTGTLVEYENVKQLTDAIVDLASRAGRRAQMGRAGHARLLEKFTYEPFKEKFTEILSQEMPASALYRIRREVLNAAGVTHV